MSKRFLTRILLVVAFLAAVVAAALWWRGSSTPRVSNFGEYRAYSAATYDGTLRTSNYLRMKDGAQLAYELILPTRNGVEPARDV
jgi:hypothetical protein